MGTKLMRLFGCTATMPMTPSALKPLPNVGPARLEMVQKERQGGAHCRFVRWDLGALKGGRQWPTTVAIHSSSGCCLIWSGCADPKHSRRGRWIDYESILLNRAVWAGCRLPPARRSIGPQSLKPARSMSAHFSLRREFLIRALPRFGVPAKQRRARQSERREVCSASERCADRLPQSTPRTARAITLQRPWLMRWRVMGRRCLGCIGGCWPKACASRSIPYDPGGTANGRPRAVPAFRLWRPWRNAGAYRPVTSNDVSLIRHERRIAVPLRTCRNATGGT
jgi:hypothetical protein